MNRRTDRVAFGCFTAASAALFFASQAVLPIFADDTQLTRADKECQAYHGEMRGHVGDAAHPTKTLQWCLKAEQENFALASLQHGEAQQFTELRHAHAMQYGAEATLVETQGAGGPLNLLHKINRINHAIFYHSRSVRVHHLAAAQYTEVDELIAYAQAQAPKPRAPKT